ncbi:MAG TPA: hypothetical protein VK208_20660 [Pyrinomonadaceae bacterium]|nr:hypothetical protein [Pyrinomonadaceae bacterium]
MAISGEGQMYRLIVLTLVLLFSVVPASTQRTSPPSKAELAQITERGRQLAAYDVAAWYASDAVVALKPAEGSVGRYIARKNGDVWIVAFGRLNEKRDKFLIAYEATQGTNAKEFSVKKFEKPKEDTGFCLSAAKAIDISLADFKGAPRPYNVAVLPADSTQIYVYVVPAQTKEGIFPLGGDARYLVSTDGSKIMEKRQLHISIIEFSAPPTSQGLQGSFHTAVVDDIPEDTDVFHVLSRHPSIPELIATKQYVFQIETDGTINYIMTWEAFKKIKGK